MGAVSGRREGLSMLTWRTEKTYREWGWRLADFIQPRELETATGEDLKSFLSHLAVKGRVSIATQKQALNALIFLFREALGREAGDLTGFQLPRREPRIPTVLSRKECQRLFEAMEGTPRLMAELMYGRGPRLWNCSGCGSRTWTSRGCRSSCGSAKETRLRPRAPARQAKTG